MHNPINVNTLKEVRELLKHLYFLQEKYTLTGHHNYIGKMSNFTDNIQSITGKTPSVWGSDFGFSDSDDKDSILFRDELFKESVKWHRKGAMVVISYHQGNPSIGEPCVFKGGVQSPFSRDQWEELLTEGSSLYGKWAHMMDLQADFLKKLEAEKVPVVFRPYHEMNGDWFWWGGEPEYFKRLWIQTYGYFTEKHKVNNLLWAWCSDKPREGVEEYFPGHEFVDILGCDIYPEEGKEVYPQAYYDRIKTLAGDKILALTENSVIPDSETLERQPWSWFMGWAELTAEYHEREELVKLYHNGKMISLEKDRGII